VITALRPAPAISSIVPVAIPRGDLREGGFQVVDNECQDAVASTLRISQ
jgi:hypothetical protein